MAANMYRVGDYVFFETSSTSPYQIRRIEELCKTVNGNVEAKVMCFYRRRDISASLIQLADKHQNMMEEDNEDGIRLTKEDLSDKQQHQIRHRELFLSRQVETLPATHIRGKCSVTLLNETESLMAYLNREDSFFYSLVYDPQQKTLLADKGEIRVGARYQAEPVPPVLAEGESDDRTLAELEELRWNPTGIEDDKIIDSFLIIARSVGTFARALDCTSTVRQPSLHISAAAASRDITLFNAMDMLHKANYNVSSAIASLVPRTGPILCRDEMEEWSASEANLFEEALDKYGKDFADIQRDYLPWKTMKSIIEYYYMWKTTDRYVQQKRVKAAESEGKLKQVYIPNYNKPNPAKIVDKVTGTDGLYQYACEGCYTTHSSEWFAWGPAQMQCRLCASCWTYWKKFGGLRMPTRLDGGNQGDRAVHAVSLGVHKCSISGCGKEYRVRSQLLRHLAASHGLITGPGSPCTAMKTRAAFCLVTTPLTRISRRLCRNLFNIRRAARRPFLPVNVALIKQECQQRLPDLAKGLHVAKVKKRIPMEDVSARLGVDIATAKPILLQHNISAAVAASLSTSEDQPTTRCAFVETPDDSVVRSHALTVTTSSRAHSANGQSQSKRKRSYEHINGIEDAPVAKLSSSGIIQSCSTNRSLSDSNPKNHVKAVVRVNGKGSRDSVVGRSRKHILNWVDTPDDVYYVASQAVKKLRYQMPVSQLKQAARQPCSRILSSTDSSVAVKSVQLGTNMVAKQSDSVVILS